MATQRFSRLWLLVLLMALAATFSAGCKGCQDADTDVLDDASDDPWQSTLDLLSDHVPADASNALFVVDFTTALASYPGFRSRIAAYLKDFASIEADLRNTLGVDPARPSNLAQLGVNPAGGAVCAKLKGQPLCGVTLSDHERFRSHVVAVMQGQPFNLRAPVIETELPSGGQLLRFASEEGSAVKAAVIVTEKLGFVILQPRADAIEGMAADLETPHHTPLRTRPAFQKLLKHTERSAVFAWLGPDSVVEIGGQFFDFDFESELPQKDLSQGALVGITLHADAIDGWFSVLIDEDNDKINTLLKRGEGHQAADFRKLVDDEAYALLRIRIDPEEIQATVRATFDSDDVAETTERIQEMLGSETIEDALVEALGTDMIVMATRARLLTLAGLARGSTVTASALGNGLGLILAYQLRDPDAMRTLLSEISAHNDALLSHTKDDDGEYWRIEQGPAKSTLLMLTDDAIIATTSRQQKDVLNRIQADNIPVLTEVDAAEAQTLREATDDLGMFVDLKRVANNSLGRLASNNLSDSMRDALQLFDEFWARGELSGEEWFDGSYRIQLSKPPL